MTINDIILLAALSAILFYVAVRLRRELQMLQQNSYRPGRYLRWLRGDVSNVDRVTDLLMLGMIVGGGFSRWAVYATGAVGLLTLYKGVRELRKKSKKPLVFTSRAWRLYVVALVVALATVAAVWWWLGLSIQPGVAGASEVAMLVALLTPVVMILAVWILSPVESAINRWFVNDAKRILRSMPGLIVIGITGSYGKTSTKHYLHRILSERFNVVMTPGSFNTTLGVVRTIREHLRPYTEVFIVEMGAKQRGDIAEICNLVHPSIGIITAVGEQHLESFKSIENIQRTKFELIDSLPANGVAILNDDFPMIASRLVTNVETVLRYTAGDVTPPPFETRLLGRYNLSNLYAAWLTGRALGMTDDEMRRAIVDIRAVEHRLSTRRTPGGVTIIDDAFNSNPHGAAMAMEVLAGFTTGRRIIVTPGMIELGAKQHELNREFGRQIASGADIAVIVGDYNRDAILAGIESARGADGVAAPLPEVFTFRTFAEASRHVNAIMRPGDTILYENDLPDTFK
jgi:UDP-N-acetylmuramoyl-tripeptide--D-alanyl-D-alanine ligase